MKMDYKNDYIKSQEKVINVNSVQSETNVSQEEKVSDFEMEMLSLQTEEEKIIKEPNITQEEQIVAKEAAPKVTLESIVQNQNIKIFQVNQKITQEKINFDFSAMKSINLKDLSQEDIEIFKEITTNDKININNLNENNLSMMIAKTATGSEVSYKSVEVSKTLFNLIEHASKTQKPVRMDFDSNSSVILKIDRHGRVSAEFLSSDKATEMAIKTALPELRTKFDDLNIPYKEFNYRNPNKKQQEKEQQNQQGGNLYE